MIAAASQRGGLALLAAAPRPAPWRGGHVGAHAVRHPVLPSGLGSLPTQRLAVLQAPRNRGSRRGGRAAAPAATAGAVTKGITAMTNLFPVWVVAAAALGATRPAAFAFFQPGYVTSALAVTMLGMGLTLTFDDFKRVLSTPGRIFSGFALQYTIMPLLGYAVSRYFALPIDFTVGVCLVACCPGGTASNVVTYLANADVSLSVLMTTASTLGAVVMTPLLTQALLGTLVPVDAAGLLVSTLQVVLAPVLAGAALNSAFPRAVGALAPLSALSAVLLIALICGSVIAQNAAAAVAAGPRLLAALFCLHGGGFFLGWLVSRVVLRQPERVARTNSIEVGMQNSALGAMLAAQHFSANPLAAVPCAISACMHSVLGSLLAAAWRLQGGRGAEEQGGDANYSS